MQSSSTTSPVTHAAPSATTSSQGVNIGAEAAGKQAVKLPGGSATVEASIKVNVQKPEKPSCSIS
jgi:hypothetical protein